MTDDLAARRCICGQGPEPGWMHDYDCPRWDGTVQPSPCDVDEDE